MTPRPRSIGLSVGVLCSVMTIGVRRARADSPDAATQSTVTTSPAPSTSTLDTITLHDGTVLRGTVQAIAPHRHIMLLLPDHHVERIEFSMIASTSGPSFTESAAASPAPSAPVPIHVQVTLAQPASATTESQENFLEPAPGLVRLDVESSHAGDMVGVITDPSWTTSGIVNSSTGTGTAATTSTQGSRTAMVTSTVPHRDVCTAPCSIYVHPGAVRLLVGTGTNLPFASILDVPSVGAKVRLRAPSGVVYGLGVTGLVVGSIGLMVGLGMLIGGASSTDHGLTPGTVNMLIAGGITTGVSGLMVWGGSRLLDRGSPGIEALTPLGGANSARRETSLHIAITPTAGQGAAVLLSGSF